MRRLGALGTFLALVLVLGAAFVGRDLLVRRGAGPVEPEPAAADEAQAEEEAILLADHDATVETGLGEPVRLSSIADGRPLVINFWATWCPYCVDEMPDYQRIVADYGDRVSFAFVDVADGSRERVDDAKAWLAEQGFDDLPAYFDTTTEATRSFGAYALPTTVVVSAEGEVLAISPGRIDEALMRSALDELV